MSRRRAFTLGEVVIALAVLAAAGTIAATALTRLLADRSRLDARLEAVEAATNALEEARARPWDGLTPEWAAARPTPPVLARWPGSKLTVKVEPEPGRPRVRRVTAEVSWDRGEAEPWPAVSLTTLVAARTTGGKP
jgi:type II secretory pathway pseudopilin PulG